MARKVLYFLAGMEATAGELAEIANITGDVFIRNASVSATYGEAGLEAADALAGSIPAAYLTGEGDTVDTELYPDGDVTPNQGGYTLKIFPVNPGGIAANGGTRNLYAIRADLDEATGEVTLTDVTANCAWTSGTTGKGTVGASTGLVTGANGGAGTSVITATYDPDGGSGANAIAVTTTATFV